MNLVIGPAVEKDDRLREKVRDASRFLERNAGEFAKALDVEWDITPHADHLIELKLRTDSAQVSPTFHVAKFDDPVSLELTLLRAWSYLLGAHSKSILERISELVGELQEEPAHAAN